jgi:hypothetical protein
MGRKHCGISQHEFQFHSLLKNVDLAKIKVTPTYSSIAKGLGCKYCSNKAVDPRDAASAMSKRGFKVLEPFPGVAQPWKVRCLKYKSA